MTCGKYNWQLLLDCARRLTANGRSPFTRIDLIECVQKAHPETQRRSLDPVIQGMTVNLSGGPPSAAGTPFEQVGRGEFRLRGDAKPGPADTGSPSPEPSNAIDASRWWAWEGNVQHQIAQHLRVEGWAVLREADTARGERGVDLLAEKDSTQLAIEVKGYPETTYARGPRRGEPKPTSPSLQASHWLANALMTAMKLVGDEQYDRVAIGLPDMPRYRSLLRQLSVALVRLNVDVLLVTEGGDVEFVRAADVGTPPG